jgi:PiT family inorganic phosphate transporter
MGVITLVLVAAGYQASGDHVELWVVVSAALAIALGTYSGGWRIIRTMGTGLSEIKPPQGFSAEVATGVTILASSNLGFALSTTQVASGGVMGAGLGRKGGKVRWSKAGHMVIGWFLTLPAAAAVGGLSALIVYALPFGILIDGALTVAAIVAIFQISKRNRIGHDNVLQSEVEDAAAVLSRRKRSRKKVSA